MYRADSAEVSGVAVLSLPSTNDTKADRAILEHSRRAHNSKGRRLLGRYHPFGDQRKSCAHGTGVHNS